MSEFLLKPRIRFGQDALAVLSELPARSVLLVTDKAMVKFGLADRVTRVLQQRGITFQVWDDVVADPDIATVRARYEADGQPLSGSGYRPRRRFGD
nr:aldehyde-alcohol dehydrogenase [Raoultella sp. NCTC 9187]